MINLNIRYFDEKYGHVKRIEKTEKGDWIDVYAAADVYIPSIFTRKEQIDQLNSQIDLLKQHFVIVESYINNTNIDNLQKQTILSEIDEKLIIETNFYLKDIQDLEKPSLIPLGFATQLPPKYETWLLPRSSSFKFFNVIQTNSLGVVDNLYQGDNDEYFMPVVSLYKDVTIKRNEKVGQIRVSNNMEELNIIEVKNLTAPDRGGHGSTGKN